MPYTAPLADNYPVPLFDNDNSVLASFFDEVDGVSREPARSSSHWTPPAQALEDPNMSIPSSQTLSSALIRE